MHITAAPVHVPLWQESPVVQRLLSVHAVPFAAFGFEHVPVAGLQVPAVWHASSGVHTTGVDPVQVPPWQVSIRVQPSPSLHDVPFAAFGFEHMPVAGLHAPATWHWSSGMHTTAEPAQTPAVHTSLMVHAIASLHIKPHGTAA